LQPYQLVKDLRTNVENTNPDAVLDGDLDAFMAASLAQRIGVLGDTPEGGDEDQPSEA
jgi:peptide chain release factor 2